MGLRVWMIGVCWAAPVRNPQRLAVARCACGLPSA